MSYMSGFQRFLHASDTLSKYVSVVTADRKSACIYTAKITVECHRASERLISRTIGRRKLKSSLEHLSALRVETKRENYCPPKELLTLTTSPHKHEFIRNGKELAVCRGRQSKGKQSTNFNFIQIHKCS